MMIRKFTFAALCVGILLSAGAFGGQDIFEALTSGDLAKVKAIVEADPRALEATNSYKQTPLIAALQRMKIEVAEYLLARGADVNAKETSGATPLSYAITGGFTAMAKALIDRNADIDNPAMWNLSPLAFALEFGRKDIAEMLVDKGAAVPVEPGPESYRLFFSACSNGSVKLVDRMLEKGFTIGDNQYSRGLPLLAAGGGSAAIVEKLIRLGFDMNRKNELGWAPLHAAAEKGHGPVAAILLSHGAAIDGRTLSGKSAYDIAVSLGKTDVAGLLKEKGADVSGQRFPLLKGPYLGQPEPGDKPQMFALDIVSTRHMIHGNVVFTPDGREAYWSGTYPAAGSDKLEYQILTMKQVQGTWGAPRLAPFSAWNTRMTARPSLRTGRGSSFSPGGRSSPAGPSPIARISGPPNVGATRGGSRSTWGTRSTLCRCTGRSRRTSKETSISAGRTPRANRWATSSSPGSTTDAS